MPGGGSDLRAAVEFPSVDLDGIAANWIWGEAGDAWLGTGAGELPTCLDPLT